MEKYFVPYEQALALKELGFDEPCTRYYWSDGLYSKSYNIPFNYNGKENYISVPTFSQAFRWFREKYNLHSYITCSCTVNEILSYDWIIHKVMNSGKSRDENFITDYEQTFEEAELECLKKLIEIVKEIKE
jgi:hypothetical protein